MKRLFPISVVAIALVLSGCGKEAVSPRSVDWYSTNPKDRKIDLATCRSEAPTSEVGKQNCKNAEASKVRDLVRPSPVGIR